MSTARFQLLLSTAQQELRAKLEVLPGQSLRQKVESGARYELQDAQTGKLPKGLKLRRVDKDLALTLDDSELVLEGYFDLPASAESSVVGVTDEGRLVDVLQELGGGQTGLLTGIEASPVVASQLLGWPAGALGGVALAGGAGGGGGTDAQAERAAALKTLQSAAQANNAASTQLAASVYAQAGIQGVSEANVSAINSALDSLAVDGTRVDKLDKLQALVDSYNRILAAADNRDGNSTALPTASDYAAVGLANVGIEGAALLSDVVDGKGPADVNTVTALQSLADAVSAVQGYASQASTAPTASQLNALVWGLQDTQGHALAVNETNLTAVLHALATANGQGAVRSQSALATLVMQVLDGGGTPLALVQAAAQNNTASTLDVSVYADAGVVGVTQTNLAAINSALDTSAVDGNAVSSQTRLQALVDSYNKVLAAANGKLGDTTGAAQPTQGDFSALGLTGVSTSSALLLSGVVDGKYTADVNTVPVLQTLANAVRAVVEYTGATGQTAPTLAQLNAVLGGSAVTPANLVAVQAAVAAGNIAGPIASPSALADVVKGAINPSPSPNPTPNPEPGPGPVDPQPIALAAIGSAAQANNATASQLVPSVYANAGVLGVTDANVAAINSALDSAAVGKEEVDAVDKVQALVNSYNKVLAAANGTPGDSTDAAVPAPEDYLVLGVTSLTLPGVVLLSQVIDGLSRTDVGTVAQLQTLLDAANAVTAYTATAGQTAPTQAQLNAVLGGHAVTADNLAAVQAAVAAANATGVVSSQTALVQVVSAAVSQYQSALDTLGHAAHGNDANATHVPASVYASAGVRGVTDANVGAMDSALDSLAVDSAQVSTATKVQALVSGYLRILAAADGTSGNTTGNAVPKPEDYTAVGVTGLSTAAATLLSAVLDGKAQADVNTVPALQALANAAQAVQAYGGGAGDVAPTTVQINALVWGLQDAQGHALVVDEDSLSAVLQALAAAHAQGGALSQSGLAALVTQAIETEHNAMDVLRTAAQNDTASTVGVNVYANAGVHGVTQANVAAINSALDSQAVNGSAADTAGKVQAVVTAYNKVLAAANGTAGDIGSAALPKQADYAKLGLTGVTATSATLLSQVVDGLTFAAVDSVTELQILANAVLAVQSYTAATGAAAPTQAQLNAVLGGHAVTADNLAAVQAAVAAANATGAVSSQAALVQVVSAAVSQYQSALDTLGHAAHGNDANATHVPASVYASAGVRGVTDANVGAMDSALDSLAVDSAQVSTAAKVQALVSGYLRILAAADGTSGNTTGNAVPTPEDYTAVGVTGLGTAAATLLSAVLDGKAQADVNTVPALQALANAAQAVQDYGGGAGDVAPTAAQINALVWGLQDAQGHALVVDEDSLPAVLQALAVAHAQGGALSQSALAALVMQAVELEHAAIDTLVVAAQNNSAASLGVQAYVNAGVQGVTQANVAAINSALNTSAVDGNAVGTEHQVQALVDSYNKVLALADGVDNNTAAGTAHPTDLDYARLGVTGVNEHTAEFLSDVIDGKVQSDVNTVPLLQALADAANAVLHYQDAAHRTLVAPTAAHINTLVSGQSSNGHAVPVVSEDNLALVQAAIDAANSDGTPLATQQELADVVDAALQSYSDAINALKTAAVNHTPVAIEVFQAAGITGVTAGNLASANSALTTLSNADLAALAGSTHAQIQALAQNMVSSYNTILNNAGAATALDYAHVNVVVSDSATSLLDSVANGLPDSALDTVGELRDLAAAANAVLANVGNANSPVSDQALQALGVQGVRADNLAAVQAAIAASPANGSAVQTLSALQALVNSINDAPVLEPSHVLTLGVVAEDSVAVPTAGTQGVGVAQVAAEITDADGSAVPKGVAVVGVNGGTLYASHDSGQSWSAISGASDSHAYLLKADAFTQVVFVPDANYNGTLANAITFRAWDQSTGTAGTYADATVNGGISAFSAATDTVSITVTPVNDVASLSGTVYLPSDPGVPAYLEGDLASDALLQNDFRINDVDDANMTHATLTITDKLADGTDVLRFVNTATVHGSFDAATGVLTLSAVNGTASKADFEAAIQSVRYESLSENPTDEWAYGDTPHNTRTIRVTVTDDGGGTGADEHTSAPMDVLLVVSAVNDAPVITLNSNTQVTESLPLGTTVSASALTQVDPSLQITDADDTQLFGGFVRIANWNYSKDVLSLDLQDAEGNPTPTVVDARSAASLADAVTAIKAAINSHLSYGGVKVSDVVYVAQGDANPSDFASVYSGLIDGTDHANVGFLQITFGYELTQDSNAQTPVLHSLADFQNTLASLRLGSSEANTSRPVEFTVSDVRKSVGRIDRNLPFKDVVAQFTDSGTASSRDVQITFGGNAAPVLSLSSTAMSWAEGASELTLNNISSLSDTDVGDQIRHATVVLGNALATDELIVSTAGISGLHATAEGPAVYDAQARTWTLKFSGLDTQAHYTALLNQLKFRNTSSDPTAGGTNLQRTVSITVADDFANGTSAQAKEGTASFAINVGAVNDAPVVEGFSPVAHATEQTVFDLKGAFTLSDADVTPTTVMTATLSVGDATQDTLTVVVGNSGATLVSGGNGSAANAVVTGTLTQLQALLAGSGTAVIRYTNTADYPAAQAHVTLQVSDAGATGSGGVQSSIAATVSINVDGVNDAPALQTSATHASYTEKGAGAALNAGLVVFDVDGLTLSSATVQITQGLTAGDLLSLAPMYELSSSYNAATGQLTINGVATVAHYQAALRSVVYSSTSGNPTATSTSRTLTWQVNDGQSANASSNTGTSVLDITAVNDPAVVGGDVAKAITEANTAQSTSGTLTVSDIDSPASFVTQTSTVGNRGYGSFSLSAQGAWTYTMNGAHDELRAGQVVTDSFTAVTADGTQQVVTVTIEGTNDAPVVSVTAPTAHAVEHTAFSLAGVFALSDVDTTATLMTVTLSAGGQNAGALQRLSLNMGTTGVVLLQGGDGTGNTARVTGTLAQLNALLAGQQGSAVTYTYTGDNPPANTSLSLQVDDGEGGTHQQSASLTLDGVDDLSTIGGVSTASLTERDMPLSASGTLTVSDPDSPTTFAVQTNVAGSNGYGTFTLAADGHWAYTMNTAHNEFVQGQTYTDSFTATTTDGVQQLVTVSIVGTNDAPVLALSGSVVSSNLSDRVLWGGGQQANAVTTYSDTAPVSLSTGRPAAGKAQIEITFSMNDYIFGLDNGVDFSAPAVWKVYITDSQSQDFLYATLTGSPRGYDNGLGQFKVAYANGATGLLNGMPDTQGSVSNIRNASQTTSERNPQGEHVYAWLIDLPASVADSGTLKFTYDTQGSDDADPASRADDTVWLRGVRIYNQSEPIQANGYDTVWTEGDAPVSVVSANVSVADADANSQLVSATVRLTNRNDGDLFLIDNTFLQDGAAGTLGVNGTTLNYTASVQADSITVAFTGTASAAVYQAALQHVRYASFSEKPNVDEARQIAITVNDGLSDSNTAITFIGVGALNDQPSVRPGDLALAAVAEDTATPSGETVAKLFGAAFDDADPGDYLAGVMVTRNDATTSQGVWQFNNAGVWTNLAANLSDSNAQWLSSSTLLRFVPAANYNGTPGGLTVRLADSTIRSLPDGSVLSISATDPNGWGWDGSTDALSKDAVTLTTQVNAVNDAPVLTVTPLTLGAVNQDAAAPVGAVGVLVSSLLGGVTDADGPNVAKGMAITAVNANGTLYFSTDGGAAWTAVSGASTTHALLLGSDADNRVYFRPNAGFAGNLATAFVMRAWDQTSGAEASYVSLGAGGGTTAFSTASNGMGVSVLDITPPTATLSTTGTVLNVANATVSVSSSEAGTAYLVRSTVAVNSLADITSAADADWNSTSIGVANLNMALSLSGLHSGTYRLYTVDAAGNLSAASAATVHLQSDPSLNLGSLSSSQGMTINGAATNDRSGSSVSSAGDVNGDGYDDFVIGAPGALSSSGRTYVVFGVSGGVASVALSTIASGVGGFVINAQSGGDGSGNAVSAAGDVNGDGLADLLVGASSAGGGVGRSYVVFGKANTSAVELSSVAAGVGGFAINGQTAGDISGFSVGPAGDVNGDGIADLLVGAFAAASSTGRSYVVFGKTNGTAINLSAIATGVGGFAINGQSTGDQSGYSVSNAGDVNGDGLADVLVGARGVSANAGRSYVVFGKTDGTAINLSAVVAGVGGFAINAQSAGDNNGFSVSAAGDVNGDGLADVVVGARSNSLSGTAVSAGRSYVVFGKASGSAIDLSAVALGTGGFSISGQAASDQSGYAVSSAGDINGDGLGDLIVGAQNASPAGVLNAGRSYVVYGQTDTTGVSLANVAAGSGGFVINGQASTDNSGWSVSAAGDINGDGYADLLVGAPLADPAALVSGSNAGRSYVIYGGSQFVSGAIATGTGTVADELVVGTTGNDVLQGNGGVDRFSAGLGNDTIELLASDVSNLANNTASSLKARVDGGNGFDTLRLIGANLDLTAIRNAGAMTGATGENLSRISDIEHIDLATDTAANTLTLTAGDLNDLAEMNLIRTGTSADGNVWGSNTYTLPSVSRFHQLVVEGNVGDLVNLKGSTWLFSGRVSLGSTLYNVVTSAATSSQIFVKVGTTVNLNVAPVVLDLNGDGQFSYTQQLMDINSDGRLDMAAWAASQDGVLVWNKYGDGLVHDASQYEFTRYGGKTDLQGLAAAFDSNHDGVLDAQDAQFGEFMVWQDANGDGVSQASEMHTLADLGLMSIQLRSDGVNRSPAAGVTEAGHSSATLASGANMAVADAAFAYDTLPVLDLNAVRGHGTANTVHTDESPHLVLKLKLADVLAQPLQVQGSAGDVLALLDADASVTATAMQFNGQAYQAYDLNRDGQLDLVVQAAVQVHMG